MELNQQIPYDTSVGIMNQAVEDLGFFKLGGAKKIKRGVGPHNWQI